jgi:hypothetical protein
MKSWLSWLNKRRLAVAAVVLAAVAAPVLAITTGKAKSPVGAPVITVGKGERCVEDTQFMRRNHMNLLKHQRDKTLREGIRTTQHSLQGCIDCHATGTSKSVTGSRDNFCQGCHEYVAVKLDCWDCHASKPKPVQATAGVFRPIAAPAEAGAVTGLVHGAAAGLAIPQAKEGK